MTGKEAEKLVDELKDFCKAKANCSRCPFRIKVSKYDDTCKIKYPNSWNEEAVKESYLDRKARRDYELYANGY